MRNTKLFRGRKAGAELILELVLATVIFTLIIAVVFGLLKDTLTINVLASVRTAGSAYLCQISLLNLLRTPVNVADGALANPDSDWVELLLRDYDRTKEHTADDFKSSQTTLDKTFTEFWGAGGYNLIVSNPDKTLFTKGTRDCTDEEHPCYNCTAWLPLPIHERKKCAWSSAPQDKVIGMASEEFVFADSPEGEIKISIKRADDRFALVKLSENAEPSLPESALEKAPATEVEDDNELNHLSIPIKVRGETQMDKQKNYEITLEETDEDRNLIKVTLAHPANLENCAIKINLFVKGYKRLKEGLSWQG